jgi:hypothetical protein
LSFLGAPITEIFIRPQRKIGDIKVQVVINENATDTLTVTKQPVQQGASIADHAYKEPVGFSCTLFFQDNPGLSQSLSSIYKSFFDLQASLVPFTIVTPKRIYYNMMMTTLTQTTDKNTENVLALSLAFQEVIIVSVTTTTVPRTKQKNAGSTGATQAAGKKSALASLKEGIGAFFGK